MEDNFITCSGHGITERIIEFHNESSIAVHAKQLNDSTINFMDAKFSQEGNFTLENDVTLPSPLGTQFASLDTWLFIGPRFIYALLYRNLYKIFNCVCCNIVNVRLILK
jgi:hypothetical protein